MTTLNISLPKTLREFVEAKVAEGDYSTVSAYVRKLIREEQKRTANEEVELALLDGLASGSPIKVKKDYWRQKRTKLLKSTRRTASGK